QPVTVGSDSPAKEAWFTASARTLNEFWRRRQAAFTQQRRELVERSEKRHEVQSCYPAQQHFAGDGVVGCFKQRKPCGEIHSATPCTTSRFSNLLHGSCMRIWHCEYFGDGQRTIPRRAHTGAI